MKTKEEILYEFDIGKNTYLRGGNIFKDVLKRNKGIVCAEDAMLIFNTYAIPLKILKILFLSHDLEMEEDKLSDIYIEQQKRMKNSKKC